MKNLPASLQLLEDATKRFSFVVPKFHLYGHGTDCQLRYSVNLLPGCTQSDLEDPECWWAHIIPVSMSTKLMSPWSRCETIDDHACRWNWRKITQFGTSLSKGLDEAVRMKAQHSALHSKFTESFPLDVIHVWEREVSEWEKDPSKPNPFSDNLRYDNMAKVRLELAKEEVAEAKLDTVASGPLSFLRLLSAAISASSQTTHQKAELQEQRNTLLHRILAWHELQANHMPFVAANLLSDVQLSSEKPETLTLFLPSQVSASYSTIQLLREKEARLRTSQAYNALSEMRRLLRITMGMWEFKFTNIGFSQHGNTRAQTTIDHFCQKVTQASNRYRAVRSALISLDPNSPSLLSLKALEQADIWCPQHEDKEPCPGESRREISWIWWSEASGAEGVSHLFEDMQPISNEDINDCLKAEWCRSWARTAHWAEEQDLVLKEMCHVLSYLDWQAQWWRGQSHLHAATVSTELLDGLSAYTAKL
ncbi:hypothetical protein BDN71DRAFT_1512944 [Pleurotus eryngii]|uniref:Uncharacterized protein n=1 Tax=Pleurotus eryngii TaxID=5323 RepID=A0A9P6D9E0_PLEER|nr:hypothetical protein BDN71DRAFT_1512944 [Pleurotus eryngii]